MTAQAGHCKRWLPALLVGSGLVILLQWQFGGWWGHDGTIQGSSGKAACPNDIANFGTAQHGFYLYW